LETLTTVNGVTARNVSVTHTESKGEEEKEEEGGRRN